MCAACRSVRNSCICVWSGAPRALTLPDRAAAARGELGVCDRGVAAAAQWRRFALLLLQLPLAGREAEGGFSAARGVVKES